MYKFGLMFALAFCLWLWQYIAMLRITHKKLRDRENHKIIRERLGLFYERLNGKTKSVEKQGLETTFLKKIGGFPIKIRSFKMNAYPYFQQERRYGKERRKSRLPVGITFKYIDRRQTDSIQYTAPERRSGMERRGPFWDRRKTKVPCYT